jgi:hypothetical protein
VVLARQSGKMPKKNEQRVLLKVMLEIDGTALKVYQL